MPRVTLARVNAALRDAGIDAELHRGPGYFYFTGPAVDGAFSTSVMVYRLDSNSVAEWVDEARAIAGAR